MSQIRVDESRVENEYQLVDGKVYVVNNLKAIDMDTGMWVTIGTQINPTDMTKSELMADLTAKRDASAAQYDTEIQKVKECG